MGYTCSNTEALVFLTAVYWMLLLAGLAAIIRVKNLLNISVYIITPLPLFLILSQQVHFVLSLIYSLTHIHSSSAYSKSS